ncbi:MAG: DUF255 domain-containing protein [Bacteroidales bacterium]|nr:DUF255 domain-containing protein [Bacteroidales bacterium]
MKKISLLLVLFIVLFALNGKAQTKVNWTDVVTAATQGEKDGKKGKLVFIDCYTDWCKWCKVLDEKTFSNDTIARILNYYFYPVKFNAEGQEDITLKGVEYKAVKGSKRNGTHELMRLLWAGQQGGGYPSMVIRNSDFSALTVVMGFYPAADLEPILVYYAEGYNKQMSIEKFQSQYTDKYRSKVLKKIFKD